MNLIVFSIQSPNLNTILFEVSLIKIFIIQAAVVIIRKMYLVQNIKKSMKILGLSRPGLFGKNNIGQAVFSSFFNQSVPKLEDKKDNKAILFMQNLATLSSIFSEKH